MKQFDLTDVVMAAIIAAMFTFVVTLSITVYVMHSDARAHGAGEFYLTPNDTVDWRWTGKK